MDMKLEMIEKIKIMMLKHLSSEQMESLNYALFSCTRDYDIDKKITDVIVYENTNDNVLQFFAGVQKLKGKSDGSIEQYIRATRKLMDYIGKDVKEINEFDIMSYFANLSNQVSKATYNNYIHYVSVFFKFATQKKIILSNPMLDMTTVQEDDDKEDPFTDKEIELLKNKTSCIRNLAIFTVLLSTGCRVGELCSINIEDIQVLGNRATAKVYGQKGKQFRTVYFDEVSLLYLNRYLKSRTDDNPALFINTKKNKRGELTRITRGAIQKMFRKLGEDCGIENVHPHRCRHTLAQHLLDCGVPIQEVAAILGHRQIETTRIYYKENMSLIEHNHRLYA